VYCNQAAGVVLQLSVPDGDPSRDQASAIFRPGAHRDNVSRPGPEVNELSLQPLAAQLLSFRQLHTERSGR